ncbi:MAG: acyltransferase [Desulfatiglans sp.]|jgi:predicted amidohydrolase|nr:acyltransferase [Desulfatiglans sp.]
MLTCLYQNNPQFGETEKNLEQAIKVMEGIKADLVVLPELFATGYQFTSISELEGLAEEIPDGSTSDALIRYARNKNLYLVFGIAERDNGKYYNSAVLVGPDGLVGLYRKSHLFYEEKLFFTPGDTGFNVYDIGFARVGIMICYDWWFPEAARTIALKGADIICHPANLVLTGCHMAMRTRSLENGVYSVTANRIGSEARGGKPELKFTGKSQIVDPKGEVILSLEESKGGIAVIDIDVERARDKSITAMNDRFNDRRPELYKII